MAWRRAAYGQETKKTVPTVVVPCGSTVRELSGRCYNKLVDSFFAIPETSRQGALMAAHQLDSSAARRGVLTAGSKQPKRRISDTELGPMSSITVEGFAELHYTVAEIAEKWKLSEDAVRRLFEKEPGVLVLGKEGSTGGRRRYTTLRIPESVAARVHRRLSKV